VFERRPVEASTFADTMGARCRAPSNTEGFSMKCSPRRYRPSLEMAESRLLTTVAPATPHHSAHSVDGLVSIAATASSAERGILHAHVALQATWDEIDLNEPTPPIMRVTGVGGIAGIGNLRAIGYLTANNYETPSGEITLSSPKGALLLEFTSMQSAQVEPPWVFQIAGGTGSFSNASGSGSIRTLTTSHPHLAQSSKGLMASYDATLGLTMTFAATL
jgi:hypothetical protein